MLFIKILNVHGFDSEIQFPGIYPMEIVTQVCKAKSTRVLIAALFEIMKNWKQPPKFISVALIYGNNGKLEL